MKPVALAALVALTTWSTARAADLEVHVNRGGATDPLPSVVYAIPQAGHFTPRAGATAVVDQINKQFAAQVSVIETGTAVSFPNKDNIRHHVYSLRIGISNHQCEPSLPITDSHYWPYVEPKLRGRVACLENLAASRPRRRAFGRCRATEYSGEGDRSFRANVTDDFG